MNKKEETPIHRLLFDVENIENKNEQRLVIEKIETTYKKELKDNSLGIICSALLVVAIEFLSDQIFYQYSKQDSLALSILVILSKVCKYLTLGSFIKTFYERFKLKEEKEELINKAYDNTPKKDKR